MHITIGTPQNISGTRFPLIAVLILVFSLRALLDIGYVEFVTEVFASVGFVLEWNPFRFIISIIAIFLATLVIYLRRNSPLINIYFLVFLLVMIPASSFYALGKAESESFFANIIVYCGLVFFLPNSKKIQYKLPHQPIYVFYGVWFLTAITIVILAVSSGGEFVLGFEDVYDFRADNSTQGISAYLLNWSAKLLTPFLLSYAMIYRSPRLIFSSLILILLLYIFTGHKSVLAPIGLCLLIYISLRSKSEVNNKYKYSFFIYTSIGLLFFTGLVFSIYIYFENIFIPSIFFRRTFFTPPFLNSVYFEMFSSQGFVYWSNTFLSPFINYEYSDTITRVVGSYLGRDGMGANTGFVASGYMQAGYFGVFIYFLIMVALNNLISRNARINPVIFNSIFIMPFLALFSSSDLPTTMLTHGLGPAAGLLFILANRISLASKLR